MDYYDPTTVANNCSYQAGDPWVYSVVVTSTQAVADGQKVDTERLYAALSGLMLNTAFGIFAENAVYEFVSGDMPAGITANVYVAVTAIMDDSVKLCFLEPEMQICFERWLDEVVASCSRISVAVEFIDVGSSYRHLLYARH